MKCNNVNVHRSVMCSEKTSWKDVYQISPSNVMEETPQSGRSPENKND